MAEGVGSKLEAVLKKLEKLDTIESRLSQMHTTLASIEENVSRLDSDVEDLKTKSKQLGSTVNELKESIEFNEEDISDLKLENQKLQQDVCELQKQLLYMETYSRRENVKFSFSLPRDHGSRHSARLPNRPLDDYISHKHSPKPQRTRENQLEEEVLALENKLDERNVSDIVKENIRTELRIKKHLIEEIIAYKTQGAILRSKVTETKLGNNQKESCEGLLSATECLESLKTMESGKSPGTDGSPFHLAAQGIDNPDTKERQTATASKKLETYK
ncbi:unnamed protein product, partial [Porites lobata]